jgi:4'-phosphopantetheinyl transferase
VHLWRLDLADLDAATASSPAPALDNLSADERQRAARLHTVAARRRFIVTRAAMREILARYLEVAPGAIRFAYNASGKPALADDQRDIEFNLSHAEGLALCAVTRARAVGVDVERIRPGVRTDAIAARFFPAPEAAALAALPEALRRKAFFVSWARKEAWIKAAGTTIWRGLGDSAQRPHADGTWSDGFGTWTQTGVDVGPGYAAALVVAGGATRLARWEWRPSRSRAGVPAP